MISIKIFLILFFVVPGRSPAIAGRDLALIHITKQPVHAPTFHVETTNWLNRFENK